ncbi:hypothetical protein OHA71_42775 [Streptomyces sp. NBC_00444]|uniref:hypothetical protein n=1 Tax=Streptomyces sp. NBC_00444 TaxID=2975744 RepID=UPI002E2455CB
MSIDFNGVPFEVSVPGDRAHRFVLPRNRGTLPPKPLKAFEVLETAREEASVGRKKGNDLAALNGVYDTGAATSRAAVEHHREQHTYATARFGRAVGDAQAAPQGVIDHARQAENVGGVGFPSGVRPYPPAMMRLRVLAEALGQLPAVPEL